MPVTGAIIIFEIIENKEETTIDDIRNSIGCSSAIIDRLVKKGILQVEEKLHKTTNDVITRTLNKNVTFTPVQRELKEKDLVGKVFTLIIKEKYSMMEK